MPACRPRAASLPIAGLLGLLKPRVIGMVTFAGAAGLYLGSRGPPSASIVLHAIAGIAFLSASAGALNQLLERRLDAVMARTAGRPLPSGRVRPGEALLFGLLLAIPGLLFLLGGTNPLAASLGAFSLLSYLLIYIPLKRRTPLSLPAGSMSGAVPPLMGWAAARGSLDLQAASLFLILFLWQIPHFLAIARLHREDYERAGFAVLPVVDRKGAFTGAVILGSCLALLAAGILPSLSGLTGPASAGASVVLGLGFLGFGIGAAREKSTGSARRLLFASLVYLPALLVVLMIDKR